MRVRACMNLRKIWNVNFTLRFYRYLFIYTICKMCKPTREHIRLHMYICIYVHIHMYIKLYIKLIIELIVRSIL